MPVAVLQKLGKLVGFKNPAQRDMFLNRVLHTLHSGNVRALDPALIELGLDEPGKVDAFEILKKNSHIIFTYE